jgi:hypothetical protein
MLKTFMATVWSFVFAFAFAFAHGAEDTPAPGATPPSTPAPDSAASDKIVSEEGRDKKKEKKIRLVGRIDIQTASEAEGEKKTKIYDGYLVTKDGPMPFKAEDEDVLAALRAKAGETATLEGRLKDPESQEKWVLVKRIVERTQPPSDVRNPRGL